MTGLSNSARQLQRRGLMLVLSSPSGAGKTSISKALLERDPMIDMSVSVTTRPARKGEVDGRDYHFIDEGRYKRLVADRQLLEHAQVFGNYYGTPQPAVEQALSAGRDVLFDIDWQGTQQLREAARNDLVSVFILPPSAGALEQRLRSRAQDSELVIAGRMAKASDEMSHWQEYDYVIINHQIAESANRVHSILECERLRRDRQLGLSDFVRSLQSAL